MQRCKLLSGSQNVVKSTAKITKLIKLYRYLKKHAIHQTPYACLYCIQNEDLDIFLNRWYD